MSNDGFDLTVMKKKMTLVYLSFIGWVGVTLALLMPLVLISTAEDVYRTPLIFPLWIGGGALSVVMGIVLIIYQRKRLLSKVGIFFIIVGLLSLAGVGYVYYQNEADSQEQPLLAPPTIQSPAGN
jgi:multidrug transporter EmrE-like cation transporter